MAQYMLLLLLFERTTAGEAPTVSNLLNQKEPTVQKRQNKKQQQKKETGSLRQAGPNYVHKSIQERKGERLFSEIL